jgi:ABC-type polar amino acid transport system ATPase subunit
MAIARALAPGPTTLLMDEPTSGLDPARRAALGQTLRELAAEGKGILFATHDVEFARAHADRVVILAEGIVVEQGPAASVLDRPTHEATRQLLRSPEPTMANAPKPTRRPELHGKEHL